MRRRAAAETRARARRGAAGMPHHPVRGRPGLPSQGSPPLPTTSVEHNITKVVEVHTYFAIQCTQSAFDISL